MDKAIAYGILLIVNLWVLMVGVKVRSVFIRAIGVLMSMACIVLMLLEIQSYIDKATGK